MRRCGWAVFSLLLACLPVAADESQRSAEALAILEKVDAAAKAVSSVRYGLTVERGGAASELAGPSESEVVMSGWTGNIPQKFFMRVKGTRQDGETPLDVSAGGNGDTFFLVDHQTKKGYEDIDPGVLGSDTALLFGAAMIEFVHATPFNDELNGERVELLGTETIGVVECYKIDVVYAGGRGHSTWWFGKADHLPRQRLRHLTLGDGGEGTIQLTVRDLDTSPDFDDATFAMALPEGYEQIDDFAP